MKRLLILSTALLISTAPLGAKGGAHPLKIDPGDASAKALEELRGLERVLRGAKGLGFPLRPKGGPTCNDLFPDRIDCNSEVTSTLLLTDCLLDDDTVVDFYLFDGRAGDHVELVLTSEDFDTVVFLLDPDGNLFAFNDDNGTGSTNSRLVETLDQTGTWGIAVNNFAPTAGDPGNYTLALNCISPGCTPTATALCVQNNRFRVEVEWTDFNGVSGDAQVVALPVTSEDSGLFYFFSPDNWEMLVKVLDGCAINDHFWVFAAATTNVAYTLKVTDTETGAEKVFMNPLGVSSPAITSTDAFKSCFP